MNNQNKELFNNNYTFVKNNETYNQKIFDRNFLSSQMAQQTFSNPTYFNIQHDDNRKSAEDVFNKRFSNLDINNPTQGGKMGYVDFTDNKPELRKKNDMNVEFDGNYGQYIEKDDNMMDPAYQRNSDRLSNNRSFLEGKKNKR